MVKCKSCGSDDSVGVPDSLAWVCNGCGALWVGYGDDAKPGASLAEWAKDLYEAKFGRQPLRQHDAEV